MNSDLRKLAPFEPLVEEAGNGSNQPATLKRNVYGRATYMEITSQV